MKELNLYESHPYKRQLKYYDIGQSALAQNLGISQAALNQQLNGIRPMREKIEDEIRELLQTLRDKERPKKKSKRIIKRK